MDIALKQAALHQRGHGRINHRRRPAQISLVAAASAAEIIGHGFVHKAVKALPVILRQCGVERGNIVKLLMRRGQRFKALAVVKLGHIARALEKIDLARIALFD